MKLYLTSAVHLVAQHIADKESIKNKGNTLAFIDTPADKEKEVGDIGWLIDDRNALIEAGFMVTDYDIKDKSQKALKGDLIKYDYIYVSGGNEIYFLEQANKVGFADILTDLISNKGKIYIGTSAGAIVMSKKFIDIFDCSGEQNYDKHYKGLGFINFQVVPHWGQEEFKDLQQNFINKVYKENVLPFVLLTDYQYIRVNENSIDFIDVREE